MWFRTHTFRLPSYSNPTSRATASSYPSKAKGQRQRPSFCEPSRPPLEPLIAHSLTCSQTQTILLQFRCPAFQTSKVSVLLTALSFPPPLSSWRVKFTYGMFLCSKRVKGIRPEKTNGNLKGWTESHFELFDVVVPTYYPTIH